MESNYRVRDAKSADLNVLTDLHLLCFSGFFISRLGARFVKALYRHYMNSPQSIFIVVECDGFVVGFATAAKPSICKFRTAIIKDPINILIPLINYTLKNIKTAIGSMRWKLKTRLNHGSTNQYFINSICVHPQSSENGYGSLLVQSVLDRILEVGGTEVLLTTDATNNFHVINFYLKNGFQIKKQFTQTRDREMLLLSKVLI